MFKYFSFNGLFDVFLFIVQVVLLIVIPTLGIKLYKKERSISYLFYFGSIFFLLFLTFITTRFVFPKRFNELSERNIIEENLEKTITRYEELLKEDKVSDLFIFDGKILDKVNMFTEYDLYKIAFNNNPKTIVIIKAEKGLLDNATKKDLINISGILAGKINIDNKFLPYIKVLEVKNYSK